MASDAILLTRAAALIESSVSNLPTRMLLTDPILAARLLWHEVVRSCMKKVHVLLANSDRRLNNLIAAAVRDLSHDQPEVECATTVRLDELIRSGCHGGF